MTSEQKGLMPDPNACAALGCAMQTEPLETCREHRCPHRWLRQAREDRARREEHDAREKAEARKSGLDEGGADARGL